MNFVVLRQAPAIDSSQKIHPLTGDSEMGKGNNSQKNDKKNMKPKQDKAKPGPKK